MPEENVGLFGLNTNDLDGLCGDDSSVFHPILEWCKRMDYKVFAYLI